MRFDPLWNHCAAEEVATEPASAIVLAAIALTTEEVETVTESVLRAATKAMATVAAMVDGRESQID